MKEGFKVNACQVILDYWREKSENTLKINGIDVSELTVSDILNYSPSGDLFMIYIWLQEAVVYYLNKDGIEIGDMSKDQLLEKVQEILSPYQLQG